MRNLGKKYTYEIVDGETILYEGQGDNIDFDEPCILSEMCVCDKFAFDTLLMSMRDLELNIQPIDKTAFIEIAPTLKNCIHEKRISDFIGLKKSSKNKLSVSSGDIILVVLSQSSKMDAYRLLMAEVS